MGAAEELVALADAGSGVRLGVRKKWFEVLF
jgi:hypothetical protein